MADQMHGERERDLEDPAVVAEMEKPTDESSHQELNVGHRLKLVVQCLFSRLQILQQRVIG